MRIMLGLAALATVALFAPAAHAQESHKFSAKALEGKYGLPVYPTKGHVENNEVIESTDDFTRAESGVYMVKGNPEKPVDFYTKALGAPKHEVTDLGADKWIFRKDDPDDRTKVHKVFILHRKGAKLVQITLWQRKYESAADAQGD